MSFHVGQKVVCVRPSVYDDVPDPDPVVGSVYTIAWLGEEMVFPGKIVPAIDLVELPSPETRGWARGYHQDRFRPIVERKTDISIFTAMLDGVKQGERA